MHSVYRGIKATSGNTCYSWPWRYPSNPRNYAFGLYSFYNGFFFWDKVHDRKSSGRQGNITCSYKFSVRFWQCDSLWADSGITDTWAPVSTHQVNSFILSWMGHPGSAVGGTVAFAGDLWQTLFDVGVVVTLPTNVGEESAWLSKTWLTIWTGYKKMYQFVALVALGLCAWAISSPRGMLEVALSTIPGAWLEWSPPWVWLWIVHGPRIWLATSLCDTPNLSRLWFLQLTFRSFSQR